MPFQFKHLLFFGFLFFLLGTEPIIGQMAMNPPGINAPQPKVSYESSSITQALFHNLNKYASKNILIGHEDALAYGLGWKGESNRSDIKDVTGSHPAVMGWDLSKIGKTAYNIDSVDFSQMQQWMIQAYKLGCVNTISWHLDNLASGGDSWDRTPSVSAILPGGEKYEAYLEKLDLVADFIGGLKTGFMGRKRVPIILRPYHEHTGSWFWWGADHCTKGEYITLWRFTADYLRKVKKLDNILIAYSPDGVDTEEAYMERYPGDDYVDIMGYDYYIHENPVRKDPDQLVKRLRMVVELAQKHGKVPAFTETGYESIPEPEFWTDFLLKALKSDPLTQQIAYLLVWRNARPDHHYAPYPGHKSAENFKKFHQDELIWLQKDLPNMYQKP